MGYYLIHGELDLTPSGTGTFTYGLSQTNSGLDTNYTVNEYFSAATQRYLQFTFYVNNEIARTWYFMFKSSLASVTLTKGKCTFIRMA